MLQEQDLQAIARLIDERAVKTEDKFIGRLEETEEYFNTRLEEMETRFDVKFRKSE